MEECDMTPEQKQRCEQVGERLQDYLPTRGVATADVGVGLTESLRGPIPCLYIYCTGEEATQIEDLNEFEGYPVKIDMGKDNAPVSD